MIIALSRNVSSKLLPVLYYYIPFNSSIDRRWKLYIQGESLSNEYIIPGFLNEKGFKISYNSFVARKLIICHLLFGLNKY